MRFQTIGKHKGLVKDMKTKQIFKITNKRLWSYWDKVKLPDTIKAGETWGNKFFADFRPSPEELFSMNWCELRIYNPEYKILPIQVKWIFYNSKLKFIINCFIQIDAPISMLDNKRTMMAMIENHGELRIRTKFEPDIILTDQHWFFSDFAIQNKGKYDKSCGGLWAELILSGISRTPVSL